MMPMKSVMKKNPWNWMILRPMKSIVATVTQYPGTVEQSAMSAEPRDPSHISWKALMVGG